MFSQSNARSSEGILEPRAFQGKLLPLSGPLVVYTCMREPHGITSTGAVTWSHRQGKDLHGYIERAAVL
jgi:hypothetical protein